MLFRETFLEINLARLQHNIDVFRNLINPNTKILANLKGNAYGMDAVGIGKYLEKQDIDYFSVAYINEGIRLRNHGIKTNLIIFNPSLIDFQELIDYRLEPEVSSIFYLKKLTDFLRKNTIQNFPIHLKLDTGMHRAGITSDELNDTIKIIQQNPTIKLKSVFSHLAAAEDKKEDDFTQKQITNFEIISKKIRQETKENFFRHLLNTAGIFRFPEAQFDMIRPGLGLFGFNLIPEHKLTLRPIAQLKTKISQIKTLKKGETVGYNRNFIAQKNTKTALLALGYADGFNRKLGKGNHHVSINGKKASVIGNVSMDVISVDVTNIECRAGDDVVVFNNRNDIYQMADRLNTIPYEIITSITQRVPRKFIINKTQI